MSKYAQKIHHHPTLESKIILFDWVKYIEQLIYVAFSVFISYCLVLNLIENSTEEVIYLNIVLGLFALGVLKDIPEFLSE